MADVADQAQETIEAAEKSRLNSAVAVLVALSATFVALCNVKDGNVVQAMAQAQAGAVDQWAYYQSKSTKQHLAETTADQLTVQRDIAVNPSAEVRKLLDAKIQQYTAEALKYGKEKDDIKRQAEGLAKQYDAYNVHDDQFDMSEACLSVGIALMGVTALTQKRWLLLVAATFAGFGALFGVAGFAGWNLHPDWLAKLLS
ncbi:MAG TPA: DUF4337 domain-containing protein [Polyangiaceae bacterium]|nr:DUF4337 domain-containing protein [Polyangiaceae bacterium]